ncbi:hypothetical protein [Aquabacterium sp.]|uniref:hypothetical protein n=1 Tax=Aquabacterium sp. TaxID=1872578 RepID=UPI0025C3E213|nr:hypothetical protein [Aquabacterium sp.]
MKLDHVGFGGLQHAVKAAQYGQWNHHAAVLRRAIRASQEIGDVPDDIALLFECLVIFHVFNPQHSNARSLFKLSRNRLRNKLEQAS